MRWQPQQVKTVKETSHVTPYQVLRHLHRKHEEDKSYEDQTVGFD